MISLKSQYASLPVAGASVWNYEDSGNPTWVGATDSQGLFSGTVPDEYKRLRFYAHGHAPADLNDTGATSKTSLTAFRIHPAAYSGFLPGATSALWKSKNSGKFIQFTAFGYFRRGRSFSALLETEFSQYHMPENFSLIPPGPVAAPSGGGLLDLKTPPPVTEWSLLHYRTDNFGTGLWTTDPAGTDMYFRFPEPAKMLVLHAHTSTDFEEYKLVN